MDLLFYYYFIIYYHLFYYYFIIFLYPVLFKLPTYLSIYLFRFDSYVKSFFPMEARRLSELQYLSAKGKCYSCRILYTTTGSLSLNAEMLFRKKEVELLIIHFNFMNHSFISRNSLGIFLFLNDISFNLHNFYIFIYMFNHLVILIVQSLSTF